MRDHPGDKELIESRGGTEANGLSDISFLVHPQPGGENKVYLEDNKEELSRQVERALRSRIFGNKDYFG